MDFIKNIFLFTGSVFKFILRTGAILCSFFGGKTIGLLLKADPSCLSQFNKIFNTTDKTASIFIGFLELSLLVLFVKYIITGIRDIFYSNENTQNIYSEKGDSSLYNEYESDACFNNMDDGSICRTPILKAEQDICENSNHFRTDNDFHDRLFQQQMLDETNRQFMKESNDEVMKIITPVSESGYVQGPYLNPPDTFEYEIQQSIFNDNVIDNNFGSFESNDIFDCSGSFDDFGCDNDFDSFNDFGCDSSFDLSSDFGCDNSFNSFSDF